LPAISVLIVGYNSERYIEKCLRSIPRCFPGGIEVIFINNSSDGSDRKVRDQYPDAIILPSRGNIGFGPAVNLISAWATAPYLLLLNPDATLKVSCVESLVEWATRDPTCGALGGLVQTPSGKFDDASVQGLLSPLQLIRMFFAIRDHKGVRERLEKKSIEVSFLSGALMLIPKMVWDEVGGFDESFFLYAEEHDLCRRISQTGRKLLLVPSAGIVHDTAAGNRHNPDRFLMRAKGNATFFRKHYGIRIARICLLIMYLHAVSRWLAALIMGNESLVRAYKPLILRPRSWQHGWDQARKPISDP
jgi:N-acetylglucosaminyl-diphospho-decaprenol L-rhamnosyltransferase